MQNSNRLLLLILIFVKSHFANCQDLTLKKTELGQNVYDVEIEEKIYGYSFYVNFDSETFLYADNVRVLDSNLVQYTIVDTTDYLRHLIWANAEFETIKDFGNFGSVEYKINDTLFEVGKKEHYYYDSADSVNVINQYNKLILPKYFRSITNTNEYLFCWPIGDFWHLEVYNFSGEKILPNSYYSSFTTNNAEIVYNQVGFVILGQENIYVDSTSIVIPDERYRSAYLTDYIITTNTIDTITEGNFYAPPKKIIRTSDCSFVTIDGFSDFDYLVEDLIIVKDKNLFGIYSLSGELILPIEYDEIGEFSSYGFDPTIFVRKNDVQVYYKLSLGKLELSKEPEKISLTFPHDEFIQKQPIFALAYPSKYYKYINSEYFRYTPTEYEIAYSNVNNLYKVGEFWGLLNADLVKITEPIYDFIFSADYSQTNLSIVCLDSLFGLVNSDGTEIVPMKYTDISLLEYKWFIVKQNGYWGIIDTSGIETLKPLIYDKITYVGAGVFEASIGVGEFNVSENEYESYKSIYINCYGKKIKMPKGDWSFLRVATPNLLMLVLLEGNIDDPDKIWHCGYINGKGKYIIKPEFWGGSIFINDKAIVVKASESGWEYWLIDPTGKKQTKIVSLPKEYRY